MTDERITEGSVFNVDESGHARMEFRERLKKMSNDELIATWRDCAERMAAIDAKKLRRSYVELALIMAMAICIAVLVEWL